MAVADNPINEKGFELTEIAIRTGERQQPYELELEGLKGKKIFVEAREVPILKNGKTTAMVGSLTDITNRKIAEEQLIQSEKRYKGLFNSTNDGICLHEIVYNDNEPVDYQILDINPKYEELTGIKKEKAIGAIASTLYGTDKAPYLDLYVDVVKTGNSVSFETYFEPMGKHFFISVFSPVKHQFATVFQDITERKKLEVQILRSQKLEAIGTLAGGIAHDFNNLLGVILGNISYALSLINQNDDMYKVLSNAKLGTQRAETLTQQLLTFASGGAPIKQTTDLNALIKESAEFITRGSQSKCEFSLADDLWTVEVDHGQINQVINNLIINAYQAMPSGGIITISTQNIELDSDNNLSLSSGRFALTTIADQGVGISEKQLPSIFDPFFTTKQKGSGLGLATTYSIIKNHGGQITVSSEIDKGTVFSIYLPTFLKILKELKNNEKFLQQGHGKILIMDDQELMLDVGNAMLNSIGYEVVTALDGAQAIEIYRDAFQSSEPFDLVILDLTVPGGMGGAKTIPKLLTINPDAKVVVSSGYSNDPIMSDYKNYGFCGVIPKPYSIAQMAEKLNKILK